MKIIELVSEDTNDFSVVKNYNVNKMQDEFSDTRGARKYLKGGFLVELKALLSFLSAIERLMQEHGYSHKNITAAKELASSFTKAISPSVSEDLDPINIKMINDKLSSAILYFGSIGKDFGEVGETKLEQVSDKLHSLLTQAKNDISSIEDREIKKVTSKEIKNRKPSGKVKSKEMGMYANLKNKLSRRSA